MFEGAKGPHKRYPNIEGVLFRGIISMDAEFLLLLFLLATLILHHKSFQPTPANTRRTRRRERHQDFWRRWWHEEEWLGPWDYAGSDRERERG
jgi:hypothetical protein